MRLLPPPGVRPRQPEDQVPALGGADRATAGRLATDDPLAAGWLAVPPEDGVRLAEQDAVIQFRPRAGGQVRQLAGQDREGELLPAGQAGLRPLALQQAHLVLQQEDLEVLVVVGTAPGRDQVDEEGREMREHEPAHKPLPPLSITSQPPCLTLHW